MNDNLTTENLHLKTFFIQQQGVVNTAYSQLKVNSITHYAKKGIYIIGELAMYVFFAIGAVLALIIPTDPVSFTESLNTTSSITSTYHNDKITSLMTVIKAVIFIASLGFLAAGYIFRRLRKKNNLLKEAYETIDRMKTSFDEYSARWSKSIAQ